MVETKLEAGARKVREIFDKDLEFCNRCSNYRGYRLGKSEKTEKGEVRIQFIIYCKIEKCLPNRPLEGCSYCHIKDLHKAIKEAKVDEEMKDRLRELYMCPNCYDDWRGECLCLLCSCDYPSSSIPGRKGNFCFCLGCEWYNQCPEKRKSLSNCDEMTEIPNAKVEKIMELI